MIDAGTPINWSHPLNRNLRACYVSGYGLSGGAKWRDLCSPVGGINAASHGTLTNGATWRSDNLFLDGVDDYVSLGDGLKDIEAGKYITIAAMVYLLGSGSYPGLVTKTPAFDTGQARFALYFPAASRKVSQIVGGNTFDGTSALAAPLNTWSFVAITSSPGGRTNWLNRLSESTTAAPSQAAATSEAWRLGVWVAGNGNLNAVINQVRIYNRGLSADEIRWLYESMTNYRIGRIDDTWNRAGRFLKYYAVAAAGGATTLTSKSLIVTQALNRSTNW